MRNQTIHHQAVKDPAKLCPVKILQEITSDLTNEGAQDDTILAAYKDGGIWKHVSARNIRETVRWAAVK